MTTQRTWKCRRKSCGFRNPSLKRKCAQCGSPKPKRRVPAHKAVLKELTYEDFIEINGGEFCWIHRALGLPDPPRSTRLHRDHDHLTGKARGLLCYSCNRHLGPFYSVAWLEAALKYLKRSE